MKIAIMQPYFVPYAGYFRLFTAADLFVVLDCVQFIRRGWIHRNRLPGENGELHWLTLPLKKAPQQTLVKNIQFAENATSVWQDRLDYFPNLKKNQQEKSFLNEVSILSDHFVSYLMKLLKGVCHTLELPFSVVYSSKLDIPESIKGADKLITIAKHYRATHYINLAGGRTLYDAQYFKKQGIHLTFLTDYQGSYHSILSRLLTEDHTKIRQEILSQSKWDVL